MIGLTPSVSPDRWLRKPHERASVDRRRRARDSMGPGSNGCAETSGRLGAEDARDRLLDVGSCGANWREQVLERSRIFPLPECRPRNTKAGPMWQL